MTIKETEHLRDLLQVSLDKLIKMVGPISIGKPEQFPFGWRKSAKGRTVWRILEEVITQNLELHYKELGLTSIHPSDSEVSVHDMECTYEGKTAYINIKSAVLGGKKSKDDISKASGLNSFYMEDVNRQFFVATFFIKFNPNMSIEIEKVVVFPIAWLQEKDIYVNPSNNGNLQASEYKDLKDAVKRTNEDFIPLFHNAIVVANEKKMKKKGADRI